MSWNPRLSCTSSQISSSIKLTYARFGAWVLPPVNKHRYTTWWARFGIHFWYPWNYDHVWSFTLGLYYSSVSCSANSQTIGVAAVQCISVIYSECYFQHLEISCRTRRCPSHAYCTDSAVIKKSSCSCRRGYCVVDRQCVGECFFRAFMSNLYPETEIYIR